jgi:tetratricopeptide (TPR) repeat protein
MTVSKREKPRWAFYEQQVFEEFKLHFPAAKIKTNVRVTGRFSKRKRQIDILIIEETPAGTLKTVVDTKLFKRKVDVKAVDGFAGFVSDVGAQRGILITEEGYTKAALRRAFYDPGDLELNILNFAELQRFQGFGAIPYSNNNAVVVPAPFGWVIDATQGKGYVAAMYQRGVDADTAKKKKEFLYLNFQDKSAEFPTAAELDAHQVARLRLGGEVIVGHRPTVQRQDAATRLRIADVKRYKCLEVTGFLEFDDVIFFAVLLTPHETQRSNIRRLEAVLRQAVRMKVSYDYTASIEKAQNQLKEEMPATERALLLRRIGRDYRTMGQYEKARPFLEESLVIDPDNAYWIIRELLPVLSRLNERDRAKELISQLLRLDPHNPTVFNDSFNLVAGWFERDELLTLLEALKATLPHDTYVQANCDFYIGNLLMSYDSAAAKKRLSSARRLFRDIFPSTHEVFRALRIALRQIR